MQPSSELLASEFTKGTVIEWPINDQFTTISLSVKYVILDKIDIVNWYPSTYASSVSLAFAKLIYLIGIGSVTDVAQFVFNQLLLHIETFSLKISISFPHLLCIIMLSQHPSILTDQDAPNSTLRLFIWAIGCFRGLMFRILHTSFFFRVIKSFLFSNDLCTPNGELMLPPALANRISFVSNL